MELGDTLQPLPACKVPTPEAAAQGLRSMAPAGDREMEGGGYEENDCQGWLRGGCAAWRPQSGTGRWEVGEMGGGGCGGAPWLVEREQQVPGRAAWGLRSMASYRSPGSHFIIEPKRHQRSPPTAIMLLMPPPRSASYSTRAFHDATTKTTTNAAHPQTSCR